MEFDYYTLYKDWSTLDLVRVARTPNDYAPDAVIVAKGILHERRVSLEEMDAAEWELAQAEMAAAIGKPRITDYIERFAEEFRPERGQASETGPWWFTLLLACYGLYYTVNMYAFIRLLFLLHRCIDCVPDVRVMVWSVFFEVYVTVCFYFMLKQKWLGWAMLFLQTIVQGLGQLSRLFYAYEHHLSWSLLISYYALPLLLYGALGFLLCRPAVLKFFLARPGSTKATS
jgi:hypothetical protein